MGRPDEAAAARNYVHTSENSSSKKRKRGRPKKGEEAALIPHAPAPSAESSSKSASGRKEAVAAKKQKKGHGAQATHTEKGNGKGKERAAPKKAATKKTSLQTTSLEGHEESASTATEAIGRSVEEDQHPSIERREYQEAGKESLELSELAQKLRGDGQGAFRLLDGVEKAQYMSDSASAPIQCYMGPVNAQVQQELVVQASRTLSELCADGDKPGVMLNVGGYPYSIDWLPQSADVTMQYLCVSSSPRNSSHTLVGEKVEGAKASQIQIWSIDQSYRAALAMILCSDKGRVSFTRWVPMNDNLGTRTLNFLGLLSTCMQNGSVDIYSVPDLGAGRSTDDAVCNVGTPHLLIEPLISLDVRMGVPLVMEWHGVNSLAVAYSDGWLAVWHLTQCLRMGSKRARPQFFSRVSDSPISSIAWHSDGQQLFLTAYDGSAKCIQLAHPHLGTTLNHSRDVSYSIAFSDALGLPLMERPESDDVRVVGFAEGKIHSSTLYTHAGRVRSMTLSPHHFYVASGGVDGSVRIFRLDGNTGKKDKRKRASSSFVLSLFRLDRNRGQEALRMIDNLAPQNVTYGSKHSAASTAAWDPAINVTAVCWNRNRGTETWLASAMACGLVRIDVM